MITYSGFKFNYETFTERDINIFDIAKGLSNECRFGAQCNDFYSVAQHSILVSYLPPPEFALEGLLHDAAEAYIKDLPSPLKRKIPAYIEIEKRLECVIRMKYGLPVKKSTEVKTADLIMLATESRDLAMENILKTSTLDSVLPSKQIHVIPMPPKVAYNSFLRRFRELTDIQ
ncbi:HD family hydrolase [Salmonella enterica]|nr:HD family hydrolase [Salmonella enterica subsp. enterica serovar Edinburgh]EBH8903890.1 HD family hydrolase [Salmonella enterica subsp. enterica serovar 6,7:b:-]EBH8908203.1 HD family hydrolase [Salmonella enterica subsp. enterica serovar Santiago]EHG2695486.1 HD family hydrolase [Salmonella enterica]EBH8944614.1 HD family hydrolase [Salmonella enterica subsp. enterica serovar 6,7:b:-]